MKQIIADNKWLVGWRKECQNWSKRYWKGGRRIKDLELPKTMWSMYYMSLALITLPRVGNLPPLPLSMTDTVIIRKTYPADCVHVCLHTCICVSGIHGVERKETERKMKVWGHLPFFPLNSISTTGMKSYKFDLTLYFVFSLSGTSSAGGENTTGKHTLPEQILLNLSPQVCLWHLQNQFWAHRFHKECKIMSCASAF